MSRGSRRASAHVFCLLAILGPLAAAIPGCGEAAKKDEAAANIPANVQESNKNMENFMKTQPAKKK